MTRQVVVLLAGALWALACGGPALAQLGPCEDMGHVAHLPMPDVTHRADGRDGQAPADIAADNGLGNVVIEIAPEISGRGRADHGLPDGSRIHLGEIVLDGQGDVIGGTGPVMDVLTGEPVGPHPCADQRLPLPPLPARNLPRPPAKPALPMDLLMPAPVTQPQPE